MEGHDLYVADPGRVTLFVKENLLAGLGKFDLFGAAALMTQPDQVADLIAQCGLKAPS
jgi:hypothetical protein